MGFGAVWKQRENSLTEIGIINIKSLDPEMKLFGYFWGIFKIPSCLRGFSIVVDRRANFIFIIAVVYWTAHYIVLSGPA